MRVAVTGASGNIGTALLRRLTSAGFDVVGISRRAPAPSAPYDAVQWHSVDLASPDAETGVRHAVAGSDAVVHLAWGFQPSHDTAYLDRLALDGTRAVLNAAHGEGVAHLVYLSSLGAYSPAVDDRRIDESWPTGGIASLAYSRQKVTVERLLDDYERTNADAVRIARVRPALVMQRDAASSFLRYGAPAYLPASMLRHLPLLPLDRRLVLQFVHSDDVADAIVRILERRATGAFNLAAEPPVTRDAIADALGARAVHVPQSMLRGAAAAAWWARLQPLDPGWLDLGFAVPLMDSGRARRELDWKPAHDATSVLRELLDGMADAAAGPSPVLRPRSIAEQMVRLLRHGPVEDRRFP